MNNTVTTSIGDRVLAMRNAAAASGGLLQFPQGGVKLTGKLPTGKTVTLSVLSFGLLWGKLRVQLTGGYSSLWDELTPGEKERILDYAEANLKYPDDPEGTLAGRFALRSINQRFILAHGDLSAKDFAKMDSVRRAIEAARKGKRVPLPGDTVEGAYYDGKHLFRKGMLDTPYPWYDPDEVSLCAGPYSPFVCLTEGRPEGYSFSMSGGPFFKVKASDLEYLGKDTREFTVWGHEGPCADGCVCFTAEVNRWKLKEGTAI